MKSILDPSTRAELIDRISSLTDQNNAQWGKMNVYQMVKHCTACDDMYQGKVQIKRVFIGRLLGPIFLKKFLKEGKVFDKNSPTAPVLKSSETSGDIEARKKEWIDRINRYADYNTTDFVHAFFGPLTKEQVGIMAYKHSDHHLRQFGG